MPLNPDLINAARALPYNVGSDDVSPLTSERPTPAQLFLDGDRDELARRCKAELAPDAYDLAWAWANAVESETGDYYSHAKALTVAKIARHFPAMELAIRAVYDHLEAHEDHTGHDTARDWAPCCSPPACCAWPAVDDEGSDAA
jgi:hypothetical protein